MEILLSLAFGALMAAAAWLMMSRNLLRIVLGLMILGNAANLAIFLSGRLIGGIPPLVPSGATTAGAEAANPLPQALILTAIVISFALISFLLVLLKRTNHSLDTLDTEEMREAEPLDPAQPAQSAIDAPSGEVGHAQRRTA